MARTNIDYIVIGSEIKGADEKGMADICTSIREKDVPDEALLGIRSVQQKMAQEVEAILKGNTLAAGKSDDREGNQQESGELPVTKSEGIQINYSGIDGRKPKGFPGIALSGEEQKVMYEVIDFIKKKGLSVSTAARALKAASGEIQIEAMERKV